MDIPPTNCDNAVTGLGADTAGLHNGVTTVLDLSAGLLPTKAVSEEAGVVIVGAADSATDTGVAG